MADEQTTNVMPFEEGETVVSEVETTEEEIEVSDEEQDVQALADYLRPNGFTIFFGKLLSFALFLLIIFVTAPATYQFLTLHLGRVYLGLDAGMLTVFIEGGALGWTFAATHVAQNIPRVVISIAAGVISISAVLAILYNVYAPGLELPTFFVGLAPIAAYGVVGTDVLLGTLFIVCSNKTIARMKYMAAHHVAPGEIANISATVPRLVPNVPNSVRAVPKRRSIVPKSKIENDLRNLLAKNIDYSISQLEAATGYTKGVIGKTKAWSEAVRNRKNKG